MEVKALKVLFLLSLLAISLNAEEDLEEFENDTEDPEFEIEEDNGVLVLTEDNFNYALETYGQLLVEFYAPWCGHCKTLAPEYEAAAASLQSHDPPRRIAKVDATVESALGERYEVKGYPTLKFFKDGSPIDYEGPRTAQGIEDWVMEKSDPNWERPPDAVVELTSDNFQEFIDNHDLSLVEFYAPWCGHCKSLAPEYERAAKQLLKNDPPVQLAKINGVDADELSKLYEVAGYPTMIVFRRGKEYEYGGGRDEQTIVSYMQYQAGDATQFLETSLDVKNSMAQSDFTIVGFFDSKDSAEFNVYKDAGNEMRDVQSFFHTFDADVRKEYKANKNTIVIFNPERFQTKYEPKWKTFVIDADTESSDIVRYISDNNVPLVGELTLSNMETRYIKKRPAVIFFYDVDFSFDHRQATQLWRNKIVEIAKNYRQFTFMIADEDNMRKMWTEMGFDESGEEMNVCIVDDQNRKYPMEPMEYFDEKTIKSFIKKYTSGKIKPLVKSQPKPKKQGNVITVVGKTFEDIVLDETKDVLIQFHAPWCDDCKPIEPIYKDVGKKYKKYKDLVIAKMDISVNDAPANFKVEGLPMFYWFRRGDKRTTQPLHYEGGRDLKAFVQFLDEMSEVVRDASGRNEL